MPKGRIRTSTTKELRYTVVFATVGTGHSQQRLLPWPLVLDNIASPKKRTEHRMGLRLLRRDAAAVNTPKRIDSNSLLKGATSRRQTKGLSFLAEADSVLKSTAYRYDSHIAPPCSFGCIRSCLYDSGEKKVRIRTFLRALKR